MDFFSGSKKKEPTLQGELFENFCKKKEEEKYRKENLSVALITVQNFESVKNFVIPSLTQTKKYNSHTIFFYHNTLKPRYGKYTMDDVV